MARHKANAKGVARNVVVAREVARDEGKVAGTEPDWKSMGNNFRKNKRPAPKEHRAHPQPDEGGERFRKVYIETSLICIINISFAYNHQGYFCRCRHRHAPRSAGWMARWASSPEPGPGTAHRPVARVAMSDQALQMQVYSVCHPNTPSSRLHLHGKLT
jgi:hypothetical protein